MAGAGVDFSSEEIACSPDVSNKQMEKYWAVDGSKLEPGALSSPCGLLSKYYPLDSFEFFGPVTSQNRESGLLQRVEVSRTGISWDGLKGNKFKSTDKSKEWVNVESETFINWMRPNTWRDVYKAWGRFSQPLSPGEYTVRIFNGSLS